MLSTAAFNSLLKTLEEPPAHVKFLFATTDPEKVLPTILSRCQRFDLRRIPVPLITEHLTTIARQEKVEIDPAALHAFAEFDQIVGTGDRDQDQSALPKNSFELGRVHSSVDRCYEVERLVNVWQEPIGVGHDKEGLGQGLRGKLDRGGGNVDAMELELACTAQMPKERSLAAAHVQQHRRRSDRSRSDEMAEGAIDRFRMAAFGKAAAGLRGIARIAGVRGPPILRLKKIDRPGPVLVERVLPLTDPTCSQAAQGLNAAPHRTPKSRHCRQRLRRPNSLRPEQRRGSGGLSTATRIACGPSAIEVYFRVSWADSCRASSSSFRDRQ